MPAMTPADFDVRYWSKLVLLWGNVDGGGTIEVATIVGPPGATVIYTGGGIYTLTLPAFYSTTNVVAYGSIATKWSNVNQQDYHTATTTGPFFGLPQLGVTTSGPGGVDADLWGQPNFRVQLKLMFKFRDILTF